MRARHLIRTSQPQQQPLCGGHLIPIHPLTSILELEHPDGRRQAIYLDNTEVVAQTQHFYSLMCFVNIFLPVARRGRLQDVTDEE